MLVINIVTLVRVSANSGVWTSGSTGSRRYWMRLAWGTSNTWWVCWWNICMLEMMCRYPLSLRMLLSSSCSRIEKIVDTLESSSSLSWYFLVLVRYILVLNLHMIVIIDFWIWIIDASINWVWSLLTWRLTWNTSKTCRSTFSCV